MVDTAVREWKGIPTERTSVSRGWRLAPKSNREARRSENRGRFWLVLSYVLCPCHLPVTMALVVAVAGGTAVGAAMTASMWRLGVVMAALYGLALWRGFHHLRRAKATVEASGACETRWCDV
jgi:cytochrome c biogenesis protein CcdA